jgi:hypothetical protein
MSMKRTVTLAVLAALLAAGCRSLDLGDRVAAGVSHKYAVDNTYMDPALKPGEIRRVLLVPVKNASHYSEHTDITLPVNALLELQVRKEKQFEFVRYGDVLSTDQKKVIDAMDIEAKGSYDADALFNLAREINVEAVLFSTVTHYRPLKPLVFGIKFNLVDIRRGRIVWAADEVFDSSQDDVKNLARAWYYDNCDTAGNPGLKWQVVLNSMKDYIRFCISEVVGTYHFSQYPAQ